MIAKKRELERVKGGKKRGGKNGKKGEKGNKKESWGVTKKEVKRGKERKGQGCGSKRDKRYDSTGLLSDK
jgi:hypothetical protein